MKTNGNDRKEGKYYVGLDVGTESVGWAVTDEEYNLLKCNGKQMWGARLFNEASDAQDRRTARTSRRRLERRKKRLNTLEILFNNEISKKDPAFSEECTKAVWSEMTEQISQINMHCLMILIIQMKIIRNSFQLYITCAVN